MSLIDSEIRLLHLRLAALEQQKQIEEKIKSDKKVYPIKTLEEIIDAKKIMIERSIRYKINPQARFDNQQKIEFLQPILDALKDINERLQVLEEKS